MATFVKAQAASVTATIADFSATVLLKEGLGCWYLLASVLGTVTGGVVNFMMNRSWVFRAKDQKIHFQAFKYILVWAGNLVLVSGGVFVLTGYGKLSYFISKLIVSLLVGVFYNYVLQKRFVFK